MRTSPSIRSRPRATTCWCRFRDEPPLRLIEATRRPLLTQGRATYSKTHANDRTRADRLRHPPGRPGLAALLPYMDDHWRETVVRRGIEDLTTISYPTRNPLSFRQEWRDSTGRTGTDVSHSRAAGARPVRHPAGDLQLPVRCAGTVQRGPRRRVRPSAERLDREGVARPDARLRASIVVPMQNAEMAVDEIERCAPDRRFVQVMLSGRQREHARPAAILADLRCGGTAWAADRDPCRFDVSPSDDAGRLAEQRLPRNTSTRRPPFSRSSPA